MSSVLYIILAILGIDFLIFIHELGHYFMARRLGIIVEEFAVGFGKPLYTWTRKGVKWKIGMIPFGGYVKMAGMEKKGMVEPSDVKGGLLAQKPLSQIKVAAMGPVVNIAFAFVAFCILWMCGGREKPFSEYTKHIGWVSEESGPFKAGIRAGDLIQAVNHEPFQNFESFSYGAITGGGALTMSGQEIDWLTQQRTPFTYVFDEGEGLEGLSKAASAFNALGAAQFLVYDRMPSGAPNKLPEGSPLQGSGIEYGDRIVWVDGKLIFSKRELVETINEPRVLLTVKRDGKHFLTRIPRLAIADLRLTAHEKEEIDDYRVAAGLSGKLNTLDFIPYSVTASAEVESPLSYIDEESRSQRAFDVPERMQAEVALLPGDKIIAVAGELISSAQELIAQMQQRRVLLLVDQMQHSAPIASKEVESAFTDSFDLPAIESITSAIGTGAPQIKAGGCRLLNPVTPIRPRDLPPPEAEIQKRWIEQRHEDITQISDPKLREEALKELALYQDRWMLGLPLQDRLVSYNPSPIALMGDVTGQIVKTFKSLIVGNLSPKYMSGPIGIVQVIQYGWSQGVKEALFFLGMISLNLAIFNLLPIPVLDGGHIAFALWEMVTKKPLSIKVRERLIFPFVILLVAVFIYFSFNDIARIVTRLF